jgi:hypothetical protein
MPQQTDLAKIVNFKTPSAAPVEAPAPTPAPAKPAALSENSMLAQAILGLAPILAGAALGGSRGGAIGAEAGLTGLQRLEAGRREQEAKEAEAARLSKAEQKEAIQNALMLAKEERAAKAEDRALRAEARAEKRQIEDIGLKKQELAIKQTQEKQLPAGQYAAGTYARRLEQSEQVFDQLSKTGYDPTASSQRLAGLLPGELKSKARQAQEQAERNFVNAVLRRESGAAIAASEFENAKQQYFPRPGDDAQVVAQKKANRLQALAGLRAEAGKALEKIPLIAVQPVPQQAGSVIPGVQEAVAAPMTERQKRIMELKQALGK